MRRRRRQLLQVVGREHDRERRILVGEPRQSTEQSLAARQVEARSRLVEQQQARARDERPRDQRPLALSV